MHMEENQDYHLKPFDYFNSDINLLALNILLEGFYRDKNVFILENFLNNRFWNIEDITEEIKESEYHNSPEDVILYQIIQIVRITKDLYDKKHEEYNDKLQLLNIKMEEHTNADYEYQTTVATVLSVARRAKSIFENSSDVAGKRAFLNYLLQNPTVKEKKLCFNIASPFSLVLELADSPNWLRGQGSNL